MTTQDSINLLTKYLEIKKSQGECSLDGEPLDEALGILLSQVSSLSPDELSIHMHLLTPPLRCFLIPGSRPELKGLEVAFDSEGYMGVRCVADRSLGFHLTRQSAITLSQLIRHNINQDSYWLVKDADYFELACDEFNDDNEVDVMSTIEAKLRTESKRD